MQIQCICHVFVGSSITSSAVSQVKASQFFERNTQVLEVIFLTKQWFASDRKCKNLMCAFSLQWLSWAHEMLPFIIAGPWSHSSPQEPGGKHKPVSRSTILACMFGAKRPTEAYFLCFEVLKPRVPTAVDSVMPQPCSKCKHLLRILQAVGTGAVYFSDYLATIYSKYCKQQEWVISNHTTNFQCSNCIKKSSLLRILQTTGTGTAVIVSLLDCRSINCL